MMRVRRFTLVCSLALAVAGDLSAQALDHATPALAKVEDGTVLIRQFLLDPVPLPGEDAANRPTTERQEYRLWFQLRDVQAFAPDGKPVAGNAWQQTLARESPVLFGPYAIAPPGQSGPPRPKLNLPGEFTRMYRQDALVLVGNASPVKQEPVPASAAFPKGAPPRFGSALLWQDGRLYVFETRETRMHYYAPLPSGGNTHIFQTTKVTVSRSLPPGDARVYDHTGRPVPASSLAAAFAKHAPVLVSSDGEPVDPFFLHLLRPGVWVVVVPLPPRQPAGGGPAVAPQ